MLTGSWFRARCGRDSQLDHPIEVVLKVLVTGGGGFLGRYVAEQLAARGDEVRSLTRGRYPELESLGVDTVQSDIRDAAAVAAACRGVEAVIHTAAVCRRRGSGASRG